MSEKEIIKDDEIDLVELAKTIWAGRWFIAKVTGVFVIIGLIVAFTSPVEYEASTKLLPEATEGASPSLGGLGGLAGLAGIDLGGMKGGGGGGVLSTQLYPEIVNSLPFILAVMNDTIYFESLNVRTTSFDYFDNIAKPSFLGYVIRYTIGIPGLIKKAIVGGQQVSESRENQGFYRLTKDEWKLVEKFKERISLSINEEYGLITIEVEMPDAYAAAQITKRIEKEVTSSVIKYKTDKAKENLSFVIETFEEAKTEFEEVQVRLARATDRNMNVYSATAQIQLRRIENEYNVAFEVYKGLASQVKQAKIKLKEETPVFTVLEPVRIPEDKSKPKRFVILVSFIILGVIWGCTHVFFRHYILNRK
ncbi:G-rich domain on putative tyrosine kinase [Reichenbachiella agariperforans]|uniref:G-rich domain on putative tyrosine kinase n=1 Tax=Reichenbachiella agariperforans TaxID=156994 RepID=A0A1M6NV09_REIAG|nr:Wzz/FepE/Etk N-terminal domain-containing protein [Reichenbachiella agariperforans]SHJ99589.1 G-rich domain on putative tyrosine kinase [Reichenbachiella agariperforans]